jgi:hypothetical protein
VIINNQKPLLFFLNPKFLKIGHFTFPFLHCICPSPSFLFLSIWDTLFVFLIVIIWFFSLIFLFIIIVYNKKNSIYFTFHSIYSLFTPNISLSINHLYRRGSNNYNNYTNTNFDNIHETSNGYLLARLTADVLFLFFFT